MLFTMLVDGKSNGARTIPGSDESRLLKATVLRLLVRLSHRRQPTVLLSVSPALSIRKSKTFSNSQGAQRVLLSAGWPPTVDCRHTVTPVCATADG